MAGDKLVIADTRFPSSRFLLSWSICKAANCRTRDEGTLRILLPNRTHVLPKLVGWPQQGSKIGKSGIFTGFGTAFVIKKATRWKPRGTELRRPLELLKWAVLGGVIRARTFGLMRSV